MKLNRAVYGPLKRALDAACAALGLVVSATLFLAIGLLIRLDSPGPVFFRQARAGRGGATFRVFKFRSMYDSSAPTRGFQAANDPRITPVGRWLRRLSLDELPQLINVLKGEMSLIGPRPPLVHQVERYSPRQRRRLDVRPGITGLAQINGRNSISWEEKIEFDIWYADHYSFAVDLRILLATIAALFDQSGIYVQGKDSAWYASEKERRQL